MTCQISDQLTGGEDSTDCRDGGSSCGSALISKIDDFLERIRTMREELSCFKTTPTSPTTSQSKPLVKQVNVTNLLTLELRWKLCPDKKIFQTICSIRYVEKIL